MDKITVEAALRRVTLVCETLKCRLPKELADTEFSVAVVCKNMARANLFSSAVSKSTLSEGVRFVPHSPNQKDTSYADCSTVFVLLESGVILKRSQETQLTLSLLLVYNALRNHFGTSFCWENDFLTASVDFLSLPVDRPLPLSE